MRKNFVKHLVEKVRLTDARFIAALEQVNPEPIEEEIDIPPEQLRAMEIERLTNIVKGMSEDELAIVADNIPIQLCFDRIQKELQQKDELIKSIREIYSVFNEGEAK